MTKDSICIIEIDIYNHMEDMASLILYFQRH